MIFGLHCLYHFNWISIYFNFNCN